MRHLPSCILFLTILFACTQPNQNAGGNSAGKSATGVRFKFSERKSSEQLADPANWCAARFGEAAFISPDPNNPNRRIIALSNLPNRFMLDYGNTAALFMLHHVGNSVEILTSDNMPACLSNKANFQLSPEGSSFRYDNKKGIHFEVLLQQLPNGMQVAIDLPPDLGLGLGAVRCETCK